LGGRVKKCKNLINLFSTASLYHLVMTSLTIKLTFYYVSDEENINIYIEVTNQKTYIRYRQKTHFL